MGQWNARDHQCMACEAIPHKQTLETGDHASTANRRGLRRSGGKGGTHRLEPYPPPRSLIRASAHIPPAATSPSRARIRTLFTTLAWPRSLGIIQSLGGAVLALVALFSSDDHGNLFGRTIPQLWGLPCLATSLAHVVVDFMQHSAPPGRDAQLTSGCLASSPLAARPIGSLARGAARRGGCAVRRRQRRPEAEPAASARGCRRDRPQGRSPGASVGQGGRERGCRLSGRRLNRGVPPMGNGDPFIQARESWSSAVARSSQRTFPWRSSCASASRKFWLRDSAYSFSS
jgi:hypothetical protein